MKLMLKIAVTLITVFSPLLGFGESTELSSDIRSINPEYKLYAGYPMCSDVLKAKAEYDKRFLEAIASDNIEKAQKEIKELLKKHPEMVSNLEDADWSLGIDYNFPSKSIIEENSSYIDKPDHLKRIRHRYLLGWGGCFSADTKVIELGFESITVTDLNFWKNAEPKKFRILPTPIDNVFEGEFILSSTASVVRNPFFVRDCWAWVGGVQIGELRDWDGERFKIIEYKGTNGKKTQVKVTPKHRFYSSRTLNGEWLWTQVGGKDFLPNTYLYSDCKGGKCIVTKVGESKDPKTIRSRKFTKFFGVENYPEVFNVMVPETFTYYVGPTIQQKVLVHNLK